MQGSGTSTTCDQTSPSKAAPPRSPPNPIDRTRTTDLAPSPYLRLAIVVGILLPIATVPYFLSRRHISGLQLRCEELEWKLSLLERRLGFSASQSSGVKAEQDKMRAGIHDIMQETSSIQRDVMQRAAEQRHTNQMIESELRRLLEETKQTRIQFSALRTLGVSLADVAAFMNEMELRMGLQSGAKDSRGINRLRLLALQIQNLVEKERENSSK